MAWQFPSKDGLGGAGGQGSRVLNSKVDPTGKYPHEINFFHERTRSMIIAIYTIVSAGSGHPPCLQLQSVGVTPFRCALGCAHGERSKLADVPALLSAVRGWRGERLSFGPATPLDERRAAAAPYDPDLSPLAPAAGRVAGVLEDNLAFSLPESIPDGLPFQLSFGCLQSPRLFKQIDVAFDAKGHLTAWTFHEYRPE